MTDTDHVIINFQDVLRYWAWVKDPRSLYKQHTSFFKKKNKNTLLLLSIQGIIWCNILVVSPISCAPFACHHIRNEIFTISLDSLQIKKQQVGEVKATSPCLLWWQTEKSQCALGRHKTPTAHVMQRTNTRTLQCVRGTSAKSSLVLWNKEPASKGRWRKSLLQ